MLRIRVFVLLLLVAAIVPLSGVVAQDEEFVFGLILVGPHDDRGWSQAHYEAGLYVEENIPGTKMIWNELINPADNPDRPLPVVVEDMVEQGAQLIIANSDEYKNDVNATAPVYPEVVFLHVSGDAVLTGDAPPNVTNIMGQMEYGKAIAGCAAGLTTQTGKIGYVGPLINDETRRLANSAYLGAKHCYEAHRETDGAELEFEIVWIGFWFEIPGVTLSPTEVVNDFINNGADVILSGIDTTQAIVVAGQRNRAGEAVWAIPYDFVGACDEAPEACLGTPFFNWGPDYVELINSIKDGSFEPAWEWNAPNWDDLNNHDTSPIGYEKGEGLSAENAAILDEFIAELATGAIGSDEGFNLWAGPLNYQDGSVFVAEGAVASAEDLWYSTQLLEGMTGDSGE